MWIIREVQKREERKGNNRQENEAKHYIEKKKGSM